MSTQKDLHWATNDNLPAGARPFSGTPSKTEPSTQMKDQGFIPEKPIPANLLNWLLNQYGSELERLDAITVLPDFSVTGTLPGSSVFIYDGHHNKVTRETFLYGGNPSGTLKKIYQSLDDGVTWNDISSLLILVGGPSGHDVVSAAAGSDGMSAFALSNDTASVAYVFTFNTATDRTNPMFSVNPSSGSLIIGSPKIEFDPVSGLFCWVGITDTPHIKVSTASNPTGTWSARSTTNFTDSYTKIDLSSNRLGKLVCLQSVGVNTSKVLYSNDGGVTWTPQTLNHAFTVNLSSLCTYGAGFALCVSDTTSNSEVWTSIDGVTWIKAATLTNNLLQGIASAGNSLVAVKYLPSSFGALVMSNNGGKDWFDLYMQPAFPVVGGLRSMAGRLYTFGGASFYRSQLLDDITRLPVT